MKRSTYRKTALLALLLAGSANAADLTYGEKVIGSRRGHTGHQHLPWVALDTDATEERGEVYGCALGWSGSWRIAVAQLPDARVQITGGAGYDEIDDIDDWFNDPDETFAGGIGAVKFVKIEVINS